MSMDRMNHFAASIPLYCNICPKKPSFSDTSHLLTHIASKGHLSHYYKLKVRSSTEHESRALIEEYDQWYAEWNVEDLMSERMNLKDKKRPRNRQSARVGQGVTRPVGTRRRTKAVPVVDHHPSDRSIKREMRHTPPLPPPASSDENHPYAPIAHMWLPPGPSDLRNMTYAGVSFSPESSPKKLYESRRKSATAKVPVEIEDEEEKSSECTRLKGVLWPGMDIFDSATPEMRRKRNQRKDTSVLEQLETNSLEVEATERMWSPTGTLRRSKVITGLASSSPFKESPSPKRPRNNERPPLFDLNSGRSRRRQRNHDSFAGDHAVFQDEQLDLELTYGTQKRKRSFNIFQDPPEASFEHPAPFNYLTSGFHYPNHQQQQQSQSYTSIDSTEYSYKPYLHPDILRYSNMFDEHAAHQYNSQSLSRDLSRETSYREDDEMPMHGLYDTQSVFCSSTTTTTAPGYGPYAPLYSHHAPALEYSGLYTHLPLPDTYHSRASCEQDYTDDAYEDDDDDDERTVTASPSQA